MEKHAEFDAVYHKYNLKLLLFSLVVKISFDMTYVQLKHIVGSYNESTIKVSKT